LTLNNLGNLYRDTQRLKEAEAAFTDGLAILMKLREITLQHMRTD
jgi:hypothetical protein